MNSNIALNVMLCSPIKVHWRFEGTYCLQFQGQNLPQANKKQDANRAVPGVAAQKPVLLPCHYVHHSTVLPLCLYRSNSYFLRKSSSSSSSSISLLQTFIPGDKLHGSVIRGREIIRGSVEYMFPAREISGSVEYMCPAREISGSVVYVIEYVIWR
jgi:hypothetical protein